MRRALVLFAALAVLPVARAGDSVIEAYQKSGDKAGSEGRFADAEKFYRLALKEAEKQGRKDGRVGSILDDLARMCQGQGKNAEAESAYQRSIAILEKLRGEEPEYVRAVANYASLCMGMGKRSKAEPLLRQVLAWAEKNKSGAYLISVTLSNLAEIHDAQGKFTEAEALFERSVAAAIERRGKEDHEEVADRHLSFAWHWFRVGKHDRAQEAISQALKIHAKVNGADSLDYGGALADGAYFALKRHDHDKAEGEARKVLEIFDAKGRAESENGAWCWSVLAELALAERKNEAALEHALKARAIAEKVLAKDHTGMGYALAVHGAALSRALQPDEGEPLLQRAAAIYEKSFGADDPRLAWVKTLQAESLLARGKEADAEPIARRALAIREKCWGKDHKDLAESLELLAEILSKSTGKAAEAEKLRERAKALKGS